MWKPFLNLIALRAKNALNILDRFHIAQKLSDAIDDVRAAETKELMRKGKEVVLKYSRWCFLKNPENLTENQKVKLKDLLKCNLKTIRAYLLKEDFQAFWDYVSPVEGCDVSQIHAFSAPSNRHRHGRTHMVPGGLKLDCNLLHA
jgi:transposase